jgi:predicted NBD/HSP70 family sugar kinase
LTARSDTFEPGAKRLEASRVRESNRRAVLTVIAGAPGSSAAEIARITGLGPQTVARNVAELETAGLVTRGKVRRGFRGQPATELFLADEGAFSIGCEIGFRHIQGSARSLGGRLVDTIRIELPAPDTRELAQTLTGLVRRLQDSLGTRRDRLVGIGIAVPSDYAALARKLVPGLDLPELDAEALGEHLGARFVAPVSVYNDGSAACWAEVNRQPPPQPANFLYIMLGAFVSSGLVAEGRLWEGPTGSSSNLGTMIVTGPDGSQRFVHDIAALATLCGQLEAAGMSLPRERPSLWDWPALGPVAERWLDEAAAAFAKALTNAAAVIEIRRVIVDGVLPRPVLERLIDRMRDHAARLPHISERDLDISAGSNGEGAAALGAALLPIYRALFSADLEHLEASRTDSME